MINTNDLMMGNWVHYDEQSVEIIFVHPEGVAIKQDKEEIGFRHYVKAEQLFPIPLTPELMKRLGWREMVWTTGIKWNDPTSASMDRTRYVKLLKKTFNVGELTMEAGSLVHYDGHTFRPLQYLHELQNMYRWTQGKALVIPW